MGRASLPWFISVAVAQTVWKSRHGNCSCGHFSVVSEIAGLHDTILEVSGTGDPRTHI